MATPWGELLLGKIGQWAFIDLLEGAQHSKSRDWAFVHIGAFVLFVDLSLTDFTTALLDLESLLCLRFLFALA